MAKKNIIIAILAVLVVVLVGASACLLSKQSKSDEVLTSKVFTGEKWQWTKTVMNNDEVITPRDSEAFSITFTEDGKLNGTTDCNNFFGAYTETGDDLSFGPFGSTKMYCEGSQELEFTKSLGEVEKFLFTESGDLVLTLKFDSGSIIFEKSNL
jgi:heat shock protein HslJ